MIGRRDLCFNLCSYKMRMTNVSILLLICLSVQGSSTAILDTSKARFHPQTSVICIWNTVI